MEHTQEEIISALKIIQDTCRAQGIDPCHNCPLSKNDTCILQDQPPDDWKIKVSPPVWKAFE